MTDPELSDEERADRNASAVEELVAANHESNRTMADLVDHVRKETQARDRKIDVLEKNNKQTRMLTYMLGGTMLVLLMLAVFNAFNIAAANRQQDQIRAINATLLDCVNSTGECGRVNTANQARILDQVKQYELTGFYCIRNNPAQADPEGEQFLKCMQRLYPGGPTLNGR